MKTLIALLIIILVGVGAYFFFNRESGTTVENRDNTERDAGMREEGQDTDEEARREPAERVIGKSVEGRDITAYNYPSGDREDGRSTRVLFVGGIHGGYSWNTALVAYELMDYLDANPDAVPEGVRVSVIPALNPDGLYKVTGTDGRFTKADVSGSQEERVAARFNARDVDLNRNFDCDWQAEGTWQNRAVSGGASAFSEPESRALETYVETYEPAAVVVWYSAAGGVFASSCHNSVLPETSRMTAAYAQASGYQAYEEFDFYEITGDAVNWLAREGIPAISVLLSNHEDTEWSRNKAGIEALLSRYEN